MKSFCRCGCGEVLKNPLSKTKTNRGHHHRLKSVKEKKKKTCLKNYGVKNPSCSEKIKEKKIHSYNSHYGVNNPTQSKEVQEKSKQTCIERYGVNHFSKTSEFKKKYKATCLERYGVDNIFKLDFIIKEMQEKRKRTCIKKYGVDNYSKTDEFRKLSRINILKQISRQKNNGEPIYPLIGRNETKFLEDLQKCTDFKINHQYPVCGYFIDGYIVELNLAIEFDEIWHDTLSFYKKKDPIRENDIRKEINCHFFRVREKEWYENKNKIINEFKRITVNG